MDEHNEVVAELKARARRQLRARMRALRAAVPQRARAERSARIVGRIGELEEYQRASGVALFWPLEHEVDLRALDERARTDGKRVYYPVMDPAGDVFRTGFALTESTAELADRGRGFAEPGPQAPRAVRGEIELVVVPALAVSANGYRLGYGSGFYDSVLPEFVPPAVSVAVAYEFQLLAELPALDHDVACSLVVTDFRTVRVPKA
ncbi:MAG: 5-formyltetrahydrofolate cyclo-ligase [Pseudomonadota bacterium]